MLVNLLKTLSQPSLERVLGKSKWNFHFVKEDSNLKRDRSSRHFLKDSFTDQSSINSLIIKGTANSYQLH